VDVSAAIMGLVGGILIGVAAGLFLVLNGRVAGISGILGGLLRPAAGEVGWRVAFLAGMVAGGVGLLLLHAGAFPEAADRSHAVLVVAGLLVGFGTRLGSGCTSGHGVCGISRLSVRSLAATVTFIATGAATVIAARHLLGL
jgi:uncharacterized protein